MNTLVSSYIKITQGPSESYADLTGRLKDAIGNKYKGNTSRNYY